jgi:hypothetical protein
MRADEWQERAEGNESGIGEEDVADSLCLIAGI